MAASRYTSLLSLLLLTSVQAAWNPFAPKVSTAVADPAPASTPDPFLDNVLAETAEPSPAAAVAQGAEGTTLPGATDTPKAPAGPQTPLYADAGIWTPIFGNAPLAGTPYEGTTYRRGSLVIRPALFRGEALMIVLGVVYILSSRAGRKGNAARAQGWLDSVKPLLSQQFAQHDTEVRQDGATNFYVWATGRRGVREGVKLRLVLKPRGDLFMQLYEVARSILEPNWTGASVDRVEVDIPLTESGDYIVAVVDKALIKATREDRWDLSTFAPVKEAQGLPPKFCWMSEANSLHDALLKGQLDLGTWLREGTGADLLENIIVSDVPVEQPDTDVLLSSTPLPKQRQITASFRLSQHSAQNQGFLTLLFNLVDLVSSNKLENVSASKIRSRRQEIVSGLVKPLVDEQKSEKADKIAREKRAAEMARRAKMSPTEEKRLEDKERIKAMRKQQMKQQRR